MAANLALQTHAAMQVVDPRKGEKEKIKANSVGPLEDEYPGVPMNWSLIGIH
jgi:hypothetical protein